jgi:hypothetical protein
MNPHLRLFLTAYLQVLFVTGNTYFISKGWLPGIISFGFMISFLWTLNVSGIKKDTWPLRFAYSFGASFGGVSGYFIAMSILR